MRTYAVTGSASGIGAATRATLTAQGHRVIGIDIRDADVVVDLADPSGRERLPDAVGRASQGRLDAVVACAGVTSSDALAVNFFGAVATLEGLLPLLSKSTEGRAAVVASLASIHPEADGEVVTACLEGDEEAACRLMESKPAGIAYPTSKAAICRWVRRAAGTSSWAGAGLPLNAIAPGIVLTAMTEVALAEPAAREALLARVPMPLGGPALPDNIAPLLVWLTSEANTHVTGQVIFIDGGAESLVRGDTTW